MPDRRPPRRKPEARRRLAALTRGEAIAALSAIALFVFMFFDWYGYEQSGSFLNYVVLVGFDGDAWHRLDLIRWVLLLTIVVPLGVALLRARGSSWEPSIPLDATLAVLGGLAAILILFRILDLPDFGKYDGVGVRFTVELGAYLGLAAAAGIAYGGYRAMRERGSSFAGIADDLSAASRRERARVKPKRAPKPKSTRSPRPAKSALKKRSQSSSD